VKENIDRLVQRVILVPVDQPTSWVNQMAVVEKSSGKLRIYLDPQPLNRALQREYRYFRLHTFEELIPQFQSAKLFTKLDVKEAFWHVALEDESGSLTTMIRPTPLGRFRMELSSIRVECHILCICFIFSLTIENSVSTVTMSGVSMNDN